MPNETRRIRRLLAVSALVAAATVGCNETPFERVNPYDPGNPYTYTMTGGPDTTWSVLDTVTLSYGLEGDLPFTPEITWSSTDTAHLEPLGDGRFVIRSAGLVPNTFVASGSVALRKFDHPVVLRQRVKDVNLLCTLNCVDTLFALGAFRLVRTLGFDARNRPVPDVARVQDSVVITARDPAVVEPNAPNIFDDDVRSLRSVGYGSTWVLFQLHDGIDSVRVVVVEVLASIELSCPSSVAVGDTVRIPALLGLNGNGLPYSGGLPAHHWENGFDYYTGFPEAGAQATVTADGLVTGIAPGQGWYTPVRRDLDNGLIDACIITITP